MKLLLDRGCFLELGEEEVEAVMEHMELGRQGVISFGVRWSGRLYFFCFCFGDSLEKGTIGAGLLCEYEGTSGNVSCQEIADDRKNEMYLCQVEK